MGTGTSTKEFGWQEGAPLTINTPENHNVLRYYKRLKGSSSGDFYTVGGAQQKDLMLKGDTAMALMWSDYIQPLAESAKPRFGFAPIPGKLSGLAGGAFYINRKSLHVEDAARFVVFALSQQNQENLMKYGLCSPMKSAYSPAVLTRVPYAKALFDSLERGSFMFEAGSDAEDIDIALTTWVQKYIRGEISENDALRKAELEVMDKRGQK
jgi:ABC-type glycerol-3-phosphate transport system substrate-binding protein